MATDRVTREQAYRTLRATDETFWKEQERSVQGALGQPCCTLSGISSGLMNLQGNFAVVVHGENECASCFRHFGPAVTQFYCTGLTDREFMTGQVAEPLRKCLRLIAEEACPEAIFVLGACPVEVIGDRFETVVASVHAEYPDIPMIAMHTSGLKVGTQAAMLDWMFEALGSLPTVAPVRTRWTRQGVTTEAVKVLSGALSASPEALAGAIEALRQATPTRAPTSAECVSFVGLPKVRRRADDFGEVAHVLTRVGLSIAANIPHGATLEEWRALKHAQATFVADRALYPKLVGAIEAAGRAVIDIDLPVGLGASRAFYERIGKEYGIEEKMAEAIAGEVGAAEARLATFRTRWGGMKVAYGMRMLNNYEADQLAQNGLGDKLALEELGFDVTLLVQGPPDKRARFEQMFQRRGLDVKFEMFAEPWVIGDLLTHTKFDLAVLADHCRNEAARANTPMIPSRGLEAYLDGVVMNANDLDHALSNTLRGRS